MRIIAGLDTPDSGDISMVRGTRVGYLAQQDMVTHGATIWAELEKVYEPVFAMEKRLRALEKEMELILPDLAEGRECAAYINLYPPGIPLIVPGEVISRDIVDTLLTYSKQDLPLQGLIGNKIPVVKDMAVGSGK